MVCRVWLINSTDDTTTFSGCLKYWSWFQLKSCKIFSEMYSTARLLIQSHDVGTHFLNPVCSQVATLHLATELYKIFFQWLDPYSVPTNTPNGGHGGCEWDLGHIVVSHNTQDIAKCTLAQAVQQGGKEACRAPHSMGFPWVIIVVYIHYCYYYYCCYCYYRFGMYISIYLCIYIHIYISKYIYIYI